ncbi:PEP-CTERM sorting domain-containing protein [Roseateles sp. NT4]|uniref:PEP-CTERM sorting domain-containing protein n=1 Tax=Roseateles sp. NT4 TaxID=3453715 RepID=UPI003EF03819
MKTLSFIAAAVAALTVSTAANAGFVVYSDPVAFAAAAGALHTETFASAPLSGVTTANYSHVFNDFTLSSAANGNYSGIVNNTYNGDGGAPASFIGQNFYGWGSSAGNQGPTSTFTVAGASAFGFDFFNTDLTDRYAISINGIDRGAIGYISSGFFGVIANGPDAINQVQIRTAAFGGYVSSAGVDNVRVASHALPEPSALLLTAGALLALGGVRRRKNGR